MHFVLRLYLRALLLGLDVVCEQQVAELRAVETVQLPHPTQAHKFPTILFALAGGQGGPAFEIGQRCHSNHNIASLAGQYLEQEFLLFVALELVVEQQLGPIAWLARVDDLPVLEDELAGEGRAHVEPAEDGAQDLAQLLHGVSQLGDLVPDYGDAGVLDAHALVDFLHAKLHVLFEFHEDLLVLFLPPPELVDATTQFLRGLQVLPPAHRLPDLVQLLSRGPLQPNLGHPGSLLAPGRDHIPYPDDPIGTHRDCLLVVKCPEQVHQPPEGKPQLPLHVRLLHGAMVEFGEGRRGQPEGEGQLGMLLVEGAGEGVAGVGEREGVAQWLAMHQLFII